MSPFSKFHSIAALRGDGLRPELQALFKRLAANPQSELFVRPDGAVQSGADPASAAARRPDAAISKQPSARMKLSCTG